MSRHRRCPNFAWRDEDPAWIAERENDRLVFRKIHNEIKRTGESPFAVLHRISTIPLWASRLSGKTLTSWKVNFYRRKRRKRVAMCKRKISRFTLENIG